MEPENIQFAGTSLHLSALEYLQAGAVEGLNLYLCFHEVSTRLLKRKAEGGGGGGGGRWRERDGAGKEFLSLRLRFQRTRI